MPEVPPAQDNNQPQLGELAPWDYSPEPFAQLTEEGRNALKALCEAAAKKDSAARRLEVEQSWEAQLFDRGYQFLFRRKAGGWQLPTEAGKRFDFNAKPTNIYSPYGQIIISALTRGIPKTRFQPKNPKSDADITAADKAEDYKKTYELSNDPTEIQTDEATYLWTDGRAARYTRHVLDAQRFGWEGDEDNPVVPETETQNAGPQASEAGPELPNTGSNDGQQQESSVAAAPNDGGGDTDSGEGSQPSPQSGQRKPRGREITSVYGKLQHKVPMGTKKLTECHFLQLSTEYDIAMTKAMFPFIADEIEPSNGPGEIEIDRIARINATLALSANYTTGDNFGQDVTVQRTWFRPSAFMAQEAKIRQELLAAFPNGCEVVYAGKTFAFARKSCMDDHWCLTRASRGAGQNCSALGAWLIPVQKRVNDWVDLINDFFMRTVPRQYMDSEAFNIPQLQGRAFVPGDLVPFKRQANVPLNELLGTDPAINHQPELPAFIEKFINELSQLLSGGYPALSGGDTEGNDTATGITTQRDQALGRLGICWHAIQASTAEAHRQAVQEAARCRDGNISESIPGSDALTIELNDLKGNVLCFPETDSAFPESWGERQARFTAFVQSAEKNPITAQLLTVPANMKVAKDAIGLTDFEIPQADSEDKQMGEFEVLLKSGPMPNPMLMQAQEMLQQGQQIGAPPDQMQMLQQAMQQIPPQISTVPVDELCDDHETEAATCLSWINGTKGRKMKNGTPEEQAGFQNVRTHFAEHKKLADAAAQAKMHQIQKQKVSESINFADLPIDGQVQMAGQAGIQITPQTAMLKQQADKPQPPPNGAIQ